MTDEPKLAITELRCACPFCRHEFDKALYVAGRLKPGALTLCPQCGEVGEIGPNMELKKPSEEKLLKMNPKALKRARFLAGFRKRGP